MMVITSSREKRCFLSVPLRDLKAENIPIKVERTFQVGHLQVNVANSDIWVKRASTGRSRELLPHRP